MGTIWLLNGSGRHTKFSGQNHLNVQVTGKANDLCAHSKYLENYMVMQCVF